ncbi:nitroreductase [Eionea flava]
MKVSSALTARKSVRAFTEQAVDESVIRKILALAGHAPSGVNTQPWEVAVVTGDAKVALQTAIESEARKGTPNSLEYKYYPDTWVEPYKSRRKACGLAMFSTLGITREDKDRQLEQWMANYRAFDAPVMLLFFIDDILETGSYLDYGMFIQSIMLVALEHGISSCPQAALAEYPAAVRDALGYPESKKLICGMALGYEDKTALVNSYRTDRLPIDEYTRFFSESIRQP